jgi:DNA-binding CsgD family transcriptional regulator
MDLSFFAYFAIEKMRNDPPHLYLHDAFFPAQCISNGEYKENSDPDLRILAQWASRMPIIWDIKQLRGVYCQDEAKGEFLDLMMVMKELDIRSGIMLPINISGGSLRAYACFGAHRAVNHWIASELMEQSLSIGLSVHRFVLPQLRTVVEKNSKNILDQFERELLLGVVEGASDKMIARRLRTSAYNVDYHLRKMRKRFGATNRIHLAYSVSNLGLL